MAISLPRMERSSSSVMSPISLPLNLMRPPTILPTLDRSRMMPSDTVDLPQPDSPTMPIASPGITLQEKSMTAGISPRRVKKEIDRFSMSTIGSALSMFVAFTASFIVPNSHRMVSRKPTALPRHHALSVLHRLLAQRVGKQVQPEHEAHQCDRRRQRRMDEGAQQPAGVLDRRAPVGALRRQPETEIAERAEQDGRVAYAQAGIDDQRAARIGQDLPEHDVPGRLAAG